MDIVTSSSQIARKVEGSLNSIYSELEAVVDGNFNFDKDQIKEELKSIAEMLNNRFEKGKLNHPTYKALLIRVMCASSFLEVV